MEPDTAKVAVRIIAVLDWLSAAFLIFLGVVYLFLPALLNDPAVLADLTAEEQAELQDAASISGFMTGMGVFFLLLAAFCVWLGVATWRFRNWARITTIVLTWISVVLMVFYAIIMAIGSVAVGSAVMLVFGLIYTLFTLAICAVYLWILQFDKTAVGLFSG